jgi:hypothetical protein
MRAMPDRRLTLRVNSHNERRAGAPDERPIPRFVGGGTFTLACGSCSVEIAVAVELPFFVGKDLWCSKCGVCNTLDASALMLNKSQSAPENGSGQ